MIRLCWLVIVAMIFKILVRQLTLSGVLVLALIVGVPVAVMSMLNDLGERLSLTGLRGEVYVLRNSSGPYLSWSFVGKLRSMGADYVLPQGVVEGVVNGGGRVKVRLIGDVGALRKAWNIRLGENGISVGVLIARRHNLSRGDTLSLSIGGKDLNLTVDNVHMCRCQYDGEVLVGPALSEAFLDGWRPSLVEVGGLDLKGGFRGVEIAPAGSLRRAAIDVVEGLRRVLDAWLALSYVALVGASFIVVFNVVMRAGEDLRAAVLVGAAPSKIPVNIMFFGVLLGLLTSLFGVFIGVSSAQVVASIFRWAGRSIVEPFLRLDQAAMIVVYTVASVLAGCLLYVLGGGRFESFKIF